MMKTKRALFLLLGVLIFLFASCGRTQVEETASESESMSEVQTTEDGKVLLSSLSDEEFLAFLEKYNVQVSESIIQQTGVSLLKAMAFQVEAGEEFDAYNPIYSSSNEPERSLKAVYDAAKAYYEIDSCGSLQSIPDDEPVTE